MRGLLGREFNDDSWILKNWWTVIVILIVLYSLKNSQLSVRPQRTVPLCLLIQNGASSNKIFLIKKKERSNKSVYTQIIINPTKYVQSLVGWNTARTGCPALHVERWTIVHGRYEDIQIAYCRLLLCLFCLSWFVGADLCACNVLCEWVWVSSTLTAAAAHLQSITH